MFHVPYSVPFVRYGLLRRFLLLGFISLVVFPSPASWAQPAVPYEVTIEGIEDEAFQELLESVSDTVALRERPPAVMSLLRKRVDEDIPVMLKALRSRGYYAAQVKAEINQKAKPVQVIFRIDPGPVYLIRSVDIRVTDKEGKWKLKLPEPKELGLVAGEPGLAGIILDSQENLLDAVRTQGYPFPQIARREVVVDHATRSITIVFRIDPGPWAVFGPTTVTGLESIEEEFIRDKLPWKEGDPFNVRLITEAQNRLVTTRLFSRAQVISAESVGKDGSLPIRIVLAERSQRTVKVGAKYGTDEGVGGQVSWEHRNLFGEGENFLAAATVSELTYALETAFGKPFFLRDDQSLLFKFRLAEDNPDGYTSRNITTSLLVERLIRKGMTVGGGLGFKASSIDQFGETNKYALLFVPAFLTWDTSDNLLNPTHGGRLNLQLFPFYDTLRRDMAFVREYLSYSRYLQILESPSIILAARGALGAIAGAPRDTIPADERFYAGGGGSVRGYSYQSIGPLEGDEPIGGRSLLELSFEVRYRITETIGVVAFLDGGSAFESEYPDFGESVRWGTGLGFRYFTPVGPLRLDVGFPLNRRSEVDDAFQVYISIGQAF